MTKSGATKTTPKVADTKSKNTTTAKVEQVNNTENNQQNQASVPNKMPADDHVFNDEASLKEYIKGTELPELIKWAKHKKLEWKDAGKGNEPITRMRVAMAIKYHYFPKETSSDDKTKTTAQYASYSDDDLKSLLKKHKIQHTQNSNASINRMQMIMKLKKAGIIAENNTLTASEAGSTASDGGESQK